MSYIGKQPAIGNFVKLDAISVVNGQASYTMQNGGANFTEYSNVNQFLVSLNGILQSPTDSFTVASSTITFASNLVTGDVIDFIIVLGNSLDVGVPSDNTVSLAKLTATGTKDATTFLRGDNTFAEAGGGKVLQVVQGTHSTQASTTSGSFQDISSGTNVSMTCSATSSKVLILAHFNECYLTGYHGINLRITAGGTQIAKSQQCLTASNSEKHYNQDITYLHSPSSTSSIEYKIQMSSHSAGTAVGVNRFGNPTTSITLIEIGA